MPQLDFSTFSSQSFWLVVSFGLMWLIIAKMIVPKITDILNQRQRKIDDYLNAAGEFKQAAEAALEKYRQALKKANDEAAEEMHKASEELHRTIAERDAETSRRLQEMLLENERQIAENRHQTMEQIEKISVALAAGIAAKLGLENVSVADIARIAEQERNDG